MRKSLSKRVFLEAARMVAEGEKEYSCVAISRARTEIEEGDYVRDCEERAKFAEIMIDGGEQPNYFWGDPDLRVLALCLMAAMED